MSFKFSPPLLQGVPFKTLPPSVWVFMWHVLKPQWKVILFGYVCCMVALAIGASYPYFIGKFVDVLSTEGAANILRDWWWLGLPFVLKVVLMRGGIWIFYQKGLIVAEAQSLALPYQHLLFQDMAFNRDASSGAMAAKVSAIKNSLRSFLEAFTWDLSSLVVGFAVSFAILLTVPIQFTVLFAIWAVCALGLGFWMSRHIAALAATRAELSADLSGVAVDGLTNTYMVKGYGREDEEYYHYRTKLEQLTAQVLKTSKVWFRLHFSQEASFLVVILMLAAVVVWLWPQGVLTPGQVAMLVPLFLGMIDRVWRMVISVTQMLEDFSTLKNNVTTIYRPYAVTDRAGAKKLDIKKGIIEVKNVAFQYAKGERWLFKDLSLQIKPGQRVGLVGHSGAGKSTLMNLLLRFYDLQKGSIEIDGQNIAKVTQQSLRRNMVMVPQDTALFNRTILDNIRYGRPEAGEEEVIEAAKKAHAHSFIEKLPKGYASKVGERGVKLSGGQRQRIAIARAFLSAPKIVLLDEATSALDSESEVAIQKSLATLMKGRTVVAIAHRLSTLRQMDRIVVMDEGRVVEDGTHAQLLKKKGGVYARLWQLQKDGFLQEEG